MNLKLEVVKYITDVISTSGCPKVGMSLTSYEFAGDNSCGWWLNCSEFDPKGEQEGGGNFKYFDETGRTIEVAIGNVEILDGTYFHFDGNGNFEICTNSEHHCTYTPAP